MRGAVTRILTASGIAAPVLWAAAAIYCGAVRPGYNPVTQFISELAERGSSTESVMRITGFYLPGALIIIFGMLLLTSSAESSVVALLIIIHGVGRVAAGIFPCDQGCPVPAASLNQAVHNAAATMNALTLTAAALFCCFSLRKARHNRFALYSLVSAIVWMTFLVLAVGNLRTRSHVGLYQRLSFGLMNLWLAAFAVAVWRSRLRPTEPSVAA